MCSTIRSFVRPSVLAGVLILSACAVNKKDAPQAHASAPEAILGINLFVSTDLVPPPKPSAPPLKAPDPFKPIPLDEDASSELQARALLYMTDLRENLHPHFRARGISMRSYYSGARYSWDELRRDLYNYRLSAWPVRSQNSSNNSAASPVVDLRFALIHDQTGRVVWTHQVADPFRFSVDRTTELPGWQRVAIIEGIAKDLIALMEQDGVLTNAYR